MFNVAAAEMPSRYNHLACDHDIWHFHCRIWFMSNTGWIWMPRSYNRERNLCTNSFMKYECTWVLRLCLFLLCINLSKLGTMLDLILFRYSIHYTLRTIACICVYNGCAPFHCYLSMDNTLIKYILCFLSLCLSLILSDSTKYNPPQIK